MPLGLINFGFASFLTPHENKESTMGPTCDPLTTTLANIYNKRAFLGATIKCFVHQIFGWGKCHNDVKMGVLL